jgi:hypothetical protein
MTDQEKRDKDVEDFREHCRQQLPILRQQVEGIDPSSIKTWEDCRKYWRLRETIVIFNDMAIEREYYPAEYYRDCMNLAIECLTHAKTVSKESHERLYEKYFDMRSDFVCEAHCKVGTKYYPRWGKLAEGEEKKIWEEVIELDSKFWDLSPHELA